MTIKSLKIGSNSPITGFPCPAIYRARLNLSKQKESFNCCCPHRDRFLGWPPSGNPGRAIIIPIRKHHNARMDLGIAPFDLLAAVWFSRARGPLQQRMRSVHTLVLAASGRWSNFERLNVRLHLLQNGLKKPIRSTRSI